ncbi:hypothetical protein FOL47_001246 [Perkinsus chesapeaki]|uniref:Protein kinase domain-containing protein n=1 Tax=Perkinsus chesapeaki TaxID=330153 RepID=A0A7J6MJH1_PERCH|nr:hypothetical protein FOL47_001246 [Perkinsus chesapeaki]
MAVSQTSCYCFSGIFNWIPFKSRHGKSRKDRRPRVVIRNPRGQSKGPCRVPILRGGRHNDPRVFKGRNITRDFDLEESLGKGYSGSVCVARRKTTGERFAVKRIDKLDMAGKDAADLVYSEAAAMLQIEPHPNVCRLYEVYEDDTQVWLVLELIDGDGDLHSWLQQRRKTVTAEQAAGILAQIWRAVQHIHRAGVVHRDLKLEHFIFAKNGVLKLIDFGFANTHGRICGTHPYVAPEVYINACGPSTDMWSIGIIALLFTQCYIHPVIREIIFEPQTEKLSRQHNRQRALKLANAVATCQLGVFDCPGGGVIPPDFIRSLLTERPCERLTSVDTPLWIADQVHPETDRFSSMNSFSSCEVMLLLAELDAGDAPTGPRMEAERLFCDNDVNSTFVDFYAQQLPVLLDGHESGNRHQLEHLYDRVGERMRSRRRTVKALVDMVCDASTTASTTVCSSRYSGSPLTSSASYPPSYH